MNYAQAIAIEKKTLASFEACLKPSHIKHMQQQHGVSEATQRANVEPRLQACRERIAALEAEQSEVEHMRQEIARLNKQAEKKTPAKVVDDSKTKVDDSTDDSSETFEPVRSLGFESHQRDMQRYHAMRDDFDKEREAVEAQATGKPQPIDFTPNSERKALVGGTF